MKGQGADCLSESGVVRLFAGALTQSKRGMLDGHLAHCERCALLVGEAARDTDATRGRPLDDLRPVVLSPGMVVAGRYHVRRLLGAGAMSEVHEVEDRLLGSIVALKTLNAKLAGDERALARLKQEVAAARRVTHANVCRIFDLGVDQRDAALDALVFLTMEYLPGDTLARWVRAHGRFSPDGALPLLIQLADALAAAHRAGIIHRDLKAENVMLVEQPEGGIRAVITDFGLAGFAQDEASGDRGSGFSGTLAYAAPERLSGGRATAASDVYSFGLVALEMLTGYVPSVPGGSANRKALATLPDGWARVLTSATELDPTRRLPTGAAAGDALRALAEGGALPARRGRPRAIALLTLGVAIAAGSIAWRAGGQQPPVAATALPQAQAATMVAPAAASASTPALAPAMPSPTAAEELEEIPRRAKVRRPRREAPMAVAAPTTDASPLSAPEREHVAEGELIRELRFGTADHSPSSARVDGDLVNPFARRRADPERESP